MHNLIDEVENNLSTEKAKLNMSFVKKDFQEPQSSKLFEAHRLLLSQFKIFNFDIQKASCFFCKFRVLIFNF